MGSASSMSSTWAMMDGGREAPPPPVPALDASVLGPPDAELVGQGWSLPVHQCALTAITKALVHLSFPNSYALACTHFIQFWLRRMSTGQQARFVS